MRRRILAGIIALAAAVPTGTEVASAAPAVPVYLFAGQSSMVGQFTKAIEVPLVDPSLSRPNRDALFWGPLADAPMHLAPIMPPTEVRQAVFKNGFGPELGAARKLAAMKGQVAIVKLAKNASSLSKDWNPDAPSGGLYHQLIARLRAARAAIAAQGRASRVAGLFWFQGEGDSRYRPTAYAYGRNLRAFIARIRSDTRNAKLPVVIVQTPDSRKDYPRLLPYTHIVRQRQDETARADSHVFLVSTTGLPEDILSPGHFTTAGTIELGYRMAQSRFGL